MKADAVVLNVTYHVTFSEPVKLYFLRQDAAGQKRAIPYLVDDATLVFFTTTTGVLCYMEPTAGYGFTLPDGVLDKVLDVTVIGPAPMIVFFDDDEECV